MTTGWDQTHLVPNTLNHLIFVTLGCIPKLSFLDYVEVGKKDGLRVGGSVAEPMCWVGGWFHDNNATLWLHLASWNLPDSQHG